MELRWLPASARCFALARPLAGFFPFFLVDFVFDGQGWKKPRRLFTLLARVNDSHTFKTRLLFTNLVKKIDTIQLKITKLSKS